VHRFQPTKRIFSPQFKHIEPVVYSVARFCRDFEDLHSEPDRLNVCPSVVRIEFDRRR